MNAPPDRWSEPEPSLWSIEPHLREEAIKRVSQVRRAPRGSSASPSPPLVLPHKGTAGHCLETIRHYNDTDGYDIHASCQGWQDAVENYYRAFEWWQDTEKSDDMMTSAFGSRDALFSMMAGAISAARMNITEFDNQVKLARQSWATNMSDAINVYANDRRGANSGVLLGLIVCSTAPHLCDAAIVISSITDIILQSIAEVKLNTIELMLSHGLDAVYLTEQGKHAKAFMDFLQTISTLDTLPSDHWRYISKVIMSYVMNAAASNRTYTAADVRGDLSEMRISRQSMDVYVETFADLTFDQKSFPEVAEALSASSVKLGVDCLLFTTALTRILERAVDWENVGIVVTREVLTRQVLKDMKRRGKVIPSLDDVVRAQKKHKNYEEKLDKYIKNPTLLKKTPLVLEDVHVKVYGLTLADYSYELICVSNPNKEHKRKCKMKKVLRTEEELTRVKGKMGKLTPIFDDLKSSLSTLTHKPPEYSKSLLRGKTLGRAMIGFALGASIEDEVDVEIKASKLKEFVKSVEINDALTSSVVVETIRSWQAWQALASVSIS